MMTPDYAAALRASTSSYTGTRERAIRRASDLFDFYCRLFSEPRVPRHCRVTVNAVIAYFVVPDDVMPERDLGPIGLCDDVFIAAYAFRVLRRELPGEVLYDAWEGDDSLEDTMDEVYKESRAEVGKKAKDILKMAGLS
jgi:uncharacterized membrane protein YkvA (DUF1232 family)